MHRGCLVVGRQLLAIMALDGYLQSIFTDAPRGVYIYDKSFPK
jgi:hypothetical protein